MASRTSTLVGKGKGALIYHNNTANAQLVTINAVANDGVSNPKISVILESDATKSLNLEVLQYTLGNRPARVIDIDIPGSGKSTSVLGNGQNGASYLTSQADVNLETNGLDQSSNVFVDPWFWVKPSEYGNASDTVASYVGVNNGTQIGQWDNALQDIKNDVYSKEVLFKGDNGSHARQQNLSYMDRYLAFDQYTQTAIGINSSGYQSICIARAGNNSFDSADTSSNSFAYWVLGSGGYNPQSYPASGSYQVKNNPPIMADGGVFTINFKRVGQSFDVVGVCPVRGAFAGGTMPTDHSATTSATINGQTLNNFISTPASVVSTFYTQNGGFQWIKYNKANGNYYFCVKESSANNAGIYEVEYVNLTQNSNSTMGTTGGGPGQGTFLYTQTTWKKVADYPVGITNNCSIPAKVGDSLWLMHNLSSTDAYYSTDLKTWTPASSFLDSGYLVRADSLSGIVYLVKADNKVITLSTGLNEMNQAGLLEKSTAVGNFTRNGIVVNAGDALYGDVDSSATTSVSFNVMDVSI